MLTFLNSIDLDASEDESVSELEAAYDLDRLASGVFVGRDAEVDQLRAALDTAVAGRGRLVMLVGESGIGKTRTSAELGTYATLKGARVLWGRCPEESSARPYWPWIQAIRSYVEEQEPGRLRSEMGPGAADIAEIVSQVSDILEDTEEPPVLEEPEQARFRLFDSITTFLKNAAQNQPLMLILDDLHWADRPTLLLLELGVAGTGGF